MKATTMCLSLITTHPQHAAQAHAARRVVDGARQRARHQLLHDEDARRPQAAAVQVHLRIESREGLL